MKQADERRCYIESCAMERGKANANHPRYFELLKVVVLGEWTGEDADETVVSLPYGRSLLIYYVL